MSESNKKITKLAKEQENITYNEERNHSIENNPEMVKMIGLVNKDIKTVIITLFICSISYRKD